MRVRMRTHIDAPARFVEGQFKIVFLVLSFRLFKISWHQNLEIVFFLCHENTSLLSYVTNTGFTYLSHGYGCENKIYRYRPPILG